MHQAPAGLEHALHCTTSAPSVIQHPRDRMSQARGTVPHSLLPLCVLFKSTSSPSLLIYSLLVYTALEASPSGFATTLRC